MSHFIIFISSINSLAILCLLPLTCRYPNNEHENDSADRQGFDFERVVYADELGNKEGMEDDDLSPDLLRLVEQEERQILPYQEITEAVNLRIKEERKKVKIGTTLSPATRKKLIDLLQDYNDVFAWSYQDMLGLDIDIVVHRLPFVDVSFCPDYFTRLNIVMCHSSFLLRAFSFLFYFIFLFFVISRLIMSCLGIVRI